jgi:hypothetical protein
MAQKDVSLPHHSATVFFDSARSSSGLKTSYASRRPRGVWYCGLLSISGASRTSQIACQKCGCRPAENVRASLMFVPSLSWQMGAFLKILHTHNCLFRVPISASSPSEALYVSKGAPLREEEPASTAVSKTNCWSELPLSSTLLQCQEDVFLVNASGCFPLTY